MFAFNGFLAIPVVLIAAIAGVLSEEAMGLVAAALPGLIVGLAAWRSLRRALETSPGCWSPEGFGEPVPSAGPLLAAPPVRR